MMEYVVLTICKLIQVQFIFKLVQLVSILLIFTSNNVAKVNSNRTNETVSIFISRDPVAVNILSNAALVFLSNAIKLLQNMLYEMPSNCKMKLKEFLKRWNFSDSLFNLPYKKYYFQSSNSMTFLQKMCSTKTMGPNIPR